MPSTLYRTLIAGIGSTGRTIVERVKRNLEARYSDQPAGVPFVAYLAITDSPPGGDSPLGPNDHFRLDTTGMAQYLEERCLRDPKFAEGLGLPFGKLLQYGTRTDDDLAGTRLGWHLVFKREMPVVRGALLNPLQRLFQASVWGRPEDKGFALDPGTQVDMFVVAGIDEVFGSSVILDFLNLLQNHPFFRKEDRQYRTTILLTTLNGLADAKSGGFTYAALSELNVKLLGDLNRPLRKDENAFAFYRTPIYEACYLIEATDERTVPVAYGEDRLEMVTEWLAQTITHPGSHDPNAATFNRIVRAFEGRFPDPNLPYYSSLVHVTYTVPRTDLTRMFAGRYGQEILSDRGVLSAPSGSTDAGKRIDELWDRLRLDPDTLINFDGERALTTPLALDVGKQQRATRLYSEDSPLPHRLAQMRESIEGRIHLQNISYRPGYCGEVANQVRDVLIPQWDQEMGALARRTGDEPVGGLRAVQGTLAVFKNKLNAVIVDLTKKREEADRKHRILAEQADRAASAAREALVNAPHWTLFLKFIGWALAMAVPVLAFLLQDLQRAAPLQTIGLGLVSALLGGPPFLYVALMAVLCAIRYLWEWGVGHWLVNDRGHNLPGWSTKGFILVGIPLFAIISGALLYRSFDPHNLPRDLAPLLLSPEYARSLAIRGLGCIAFIGVVSAAWLAFWYIHAERRIRETAQIWVRCHERAAAQEFVLYRVDKAKEAYQRLSESLNRELKQWEDRIERVHKAGNSLMVQCKALGDALYERPRQFRHLVVKSREDADRLYASQVSDDPRRETQEFFSASPLPFLAWLDQSEMGIVDAINKYISTRFDDEFWKEHDLAGLIRAQAPKGTSFADAIQRALEWISDCSPQWSYHVREPGRSDRESLETFGELRMIAGIGDEEDHDVHDAIRAFRKITGDLAPIVYATGDRYDLVITIQRRDLPLEELYELFKYRSDYLGMRDTRLGLGLNRPGPHPDLITPERLRKWEEALKEKAAEKPPMEAPPAEPPKKAAPGVLKPAAEAGGEAPVEAGAPPAAGPEAAERALVRAFLEIKPDASRTAVLAAFERVQRELTTARDGLLNIMNRYRHYALVQQGATSGRSWYELLGLPVDRGIADAAIKVAYAHRMAILAEIKDELLVAAPAEGGIP